MFCIAARDFYNEAPDLEPDEVDARAQEIFDTYIAVGSSYQVRQCVLQACEIHGGFAFGLRRPALDLKPQMPS